MKQGLKPTYQQRKVLERYKLDTYDYLVTKILSDGLVLKKRSDDSYVFVGTGNEKVLITDFDIKSR